MYSVITAPPLLDGADQDTVSTSAVGDDATGAEGATGTVVIATEDEAVDSSEFPAALLAETVKV